VVPFPIAFAKGLLRRTAFEDLSLTLLAARMGVRLLWFAARDRTERELAAAAGEAMDQAVALVRRLGRAPEDAGVASPAASPPPDGGAS
jgi:hypothetical protein